jgi:hypothetical protein
MKEKKIMEKKRPATRKMGMRTNNVNNPHPKNKLCDRIFEAYIEESFLLMLNHYDRH